MNARSDASGAAASIVVLVSGYGRNLQALIDAVADGRIPARIAAVVSNRADAVGLERARRAGIATQVVDHRAFAARADFDAALAEAIEAHAPTIVVLAGFMRVLGDEFVRRFRGRLVNIHPSLLPRHPGLRTHERALAAGEAEHGATVHFVTEELDGGPAIIQGKLSVRPEDTPQSLAERVMQDIELKIYPQAVALLARGEVRLEGARVLRRDRVLESPLTLDDLDESFR